MSRYRLRCCGRSEIPMGSVYRPAHALQSAEAMARRPRRPGARDNVVRASAIETARTEDLLALHDRLFAPLDAKGKTRILAVVLARNRPRRWQGMDGLAA